MYFLVTVPSSTKSLISTDFDGDKVLSTLSFNLTNLILIIKILNLTVEIMNINI